MRIKTALPFALFTIVAAPIWSAHADTPPDPKASWKDSPEAQALLERADDIAEKTREIRGKGPTGPIASGVMERDELEALLLEKLAEELDDSEVHGELSLLVRLGLMDPELDYERFMVDLLTEEIAGFYDDETKELYVMDGQEPEVLDAVMSHELFHAIQDQHWNIGTLRGPDTLSSDTQIARMALVEGDATAVMIDFELAASGMSFTDSPAILALMKSASDLGMGTGGGALGNAPLVIRESILFPYIDGLGFVADVKVAGGWDAVDRVYADPPMSTEQILHPERYIERDDPVLIDFEVADHFADWNMVYEDVMGELGWRLYLQQHLDDHKRDSQIADRAASGWDGDRVIVLEHKLGQQMLVSVIEMDTVDDAQELAASLVAISQLRFPNADLTPQNTASSTLLTNSDEAIWVEARGRRILYIEGLPSQESGQLAALADTAWLTTTARAPVAFADER